MPPPIGLQTQVEIVGRAEPRAQFAGRRFDSGGLAPLVASRTARSGRRRRFDGCGARSFAQQRQKQALAGSAVGKEMTDRQAAARGVAGYGPIGGRRDGNQFSSQLVAGILHHVLVLFAVESAGAVDEIPPRAERRPDIAQDFALPLSTTRHRFGRPLLARLQVFAKHALARAGNVGRHEVEGRNQAAEIGRIGVGHDGVGVSPLREVFGEDIGAGFHGFVGHEQRFIGQERAPEGAFSAGSGAEIEHAARRFVGESRRVGRGHEHRGGFLHVVGAGMPTRIEGKGGARQKVAAVGTPRDGRGVKGRRVGRRLRRGRPPLGRNRRRSGRCGRDTGRRGEETQLLVGTLGGVAAHTHGSVAFGEGQAKRARLGGTEESAKAGDKSFGKHHVLWGEINDECPSR